MSFILDALKKSESERQRHSGPALFEVKTATARAGLPPWAFALLALLAINLVALAYFVLRDPAPPAVAATAPIGTVAASPAAEATPASVRAILPPTASSGGFAAGEEFADIESTGDAAMESLTTADGAAADADFSDNSAPASAAPTPPTTNSSVARDPGDAPSIEELPASIVNQLPPLHLDLHVYGPRPSERFVMVNMRRLREGDALPEGIRLETITPQGAILSYRGNRFMLERD